MDNNCNGILHSSCFFTTSHVEFSKIVLWGAGMASYVKDQCPVCACTSHGVIGAVNDKNPPVHVPEGSSIVKCKACKLIYVNPMPYWDSSDYAKLYDETYFDYYNSNEQAKWFEIRKSVIPNNRFKRIEPHVKSKTKTLLEIGAGEYAFMCCHLLSKGWTCTAQEPSHLYASKLQKIEGLNIETKDIRELEGEYTLIYADSVLEHVPDPVNYVRKLASLLTPGGVLYTVSPNEYSLYNFLMNINSKRKGNTPHYIAPYTEPYHLVGFTKKSLQICARESGLTLYQYKIIEDYKAFNAINTKKSPFTKYPLAVLYALAQMFGMGTNGEAMFIKKNL